MEKFGAAVDSLSRTWSDRNPEMAYERAFLSIAVKLLMHVTKKVPAMVQCNQLVQAINGNSRVRSYIESCGGWVRMRGRRWRLPGRLWLVVPPASPACLARLPPMPSASPRRAQQPARLQPWERGFAKYLGEVLPTPASNFPSASLSQGLIPYLSTSELSWLP